MSCEDKINFTAISPETRVAALTSSTDLPLTSVWIRLRITWLTLCAVLFGVVAPSVAHGLTAATGRVWVEVCSVEGTRRVALDIESGQTPAQVNASADCPFCLLQGDNPIPPEANRPVIAELVTAATASLFSLVRLYPAQFVWAAHYTRAPPSFS